MQYQHQYMRIQLLSSLSDEICSIGARHGAVQLFDFVDMNCGAVPEGTYEEAIDPESPEQFLTVYMRIAELRFATAVTQVLLMNIDNLEEIKTACLNKGRSLNAEKVPDAATAFALINLCLLDGMCGTETKKIITYEKNKVVWQKTVDTHEEFWQKAGSTVEIYYDLMEEFIKGLLEGSSVKFSAENMSVFTLEG